ncbi:MAG TPA: hypothetical protein DCQ26_17150 [Marinilabiliales bacterium]|nr:MAG: hypothetical protein A2437_15945 [Bacteroidetes bacterium RIFOXYC2_FULL_40_12]HAN00324.1 hypothetical protein [Marinilabiliales bacterium]HBY53588.1 hypothetical protein [Marinilabiliales bacterium]
MVLHRKSEIGTSKTLKHNPMSEKTQTILIGALSILTLSAGFLGLLFIFPLLETERVEDLIRTGFIFLASAIFFSSGVVSLAIIKKRKRH